MKYATIFVVVALATIVYAVPKPDDHYTTKYDTVDIDELIKNDRLFNNYLACLLGQGKCTRDAEEIKKHFKESLATCCAKCSEYQKTGLAKLHKHLKENKPAKLQEIYAQYAPNNEYETKCVQNAKK
ncbi:ejaculatory bulb-specific protein 3-like [Chrysoperla carnea]|uniref:ejaculatory bulb-specific protein 3-like n=1 Tax=Chrysoperla carnea TaxID=189513 RepID=UPI001D08BBE7|nr:ejaculatory bulb-specific protein 3-like [Chrysoperla carnea]